MVALRLAADAHPRRLTVFCVLLALGPFVHIAGLNTQIPMPWSVLRYVPILGPGAVARPLRRAGVDGVAVLLAQALAHIGRRYPERRRHVLAVVGVLLAIELCPARARCTRPAIPALYQTIAARSAAAIRVLELPVGVPRRHHLDGQLLARSQYHQTLHGKAIVGGYLSRVSPRRRLDARRAPVLNALIAAQRGPAPSTPEQDAARATRRRVPAARRASATS